MEQGKINWQSPVARALFKNRVGDTVEVKTEEGRETLEILSIDYIIDKD
jgi:transcription elongation factor GreB